MKRGLILAMSIAISAVVWIGSGQLGSDEEQVTADEMTETEAASKKPALPTVRVSASKGKPVAQKLTLFGRTEAARTVDIRAETDGRIVGLGVEEGDDISTDTLIARLDIEDRQAQVNDAIAQVKFREVAYEAAEKLSQKQFRSEVSLAEELAALETARATLTAARVELARTTIQAPFTGIAERLDVELGDYVQTGDIIAHIVDLNPSVIAVQVTERDIMSLETGQLAEIRLASGEVRIGTVSYVAHTGSEETRTFRVEIEVGNDNSSISAGMTADVILATRSVLAHLVSPAMLTLDDIGRLGVKTVEEGNVAAFHPIRIVSDTLDGVWVTGLPLETRVITVGHEFVLPGQQVRIIAPNQEG